MNKVSEMTTIERGLRNMELVLPPQNVEKLSLWQLSEEVSHLAFPGEKIDAPSSLFVFRESNILRRCANTVISSSPFEIAVLITIVANCIVLAMDSEDTKQENPPLSQFCNDADIYFLCLFTVEAGIKILALGFILHEKSYLRNFWNILDFIVVVTGFIVAFSDFDQLSFLKAIRVLRPLKLAYGINSLKVVLKSIAKAMRPLLQIGLLVFFTIIMFGIIGMEFYSGAFHRRCVHNEIADFTIDTLCYVGELPEAKAQGACPPMKPAYFVCPDNFTCQLYWEGINYGITNFDNIGYAMLTVFQCLTKEGWTDLMYAADKVNGATFNWLYFVPLIILGAFFMMNLILGVLSGQFAKEREQIENKSQFRKLRRKQVANTELENYVLWIQKAEETMLLEDSLGADEKLAILQKRMEARKKLLKTTCKTEEDIPPDPMAEYIETQEMKEKEKDTQSTKRDSNLWNYEKALRFSLRRLVKSQAFFWAIVIIVFLNTICVALQYYGQPGWLDDFLYYANWVFLGLFVFEMFMKIYALGLREYFRSSFNMFDMIVIACSLFEVIYTHYDKDADFGFSVLRALRLLRIFKVTRHWISLRNLVLSLINSIQSICSLLFLLFLFIFIFSLLGMNLFKGNYRFDNNKRPYQNFDSISKAMITVFQIIAGPDWNTRMYDGIRAQRKVYGEYAMFYSLYFILLVVLGTFTLLNVFLAIAVDNLTSAQELTAMEEEQAQEEMERKERLKSNLYSPNSTMDFGGPIEPVPIAFEEPMKENENYLRRDDDVFHQCSDPAVDFNFANMQQECGLPEEKPILEGPVSTMIPYSSLFIFSPHNIVRRVCHFIVNLQFFDLCIMMAIVASSVALAANDPVCEVSTLNNLLEKLDYAFTVIFTLEMVLKIIDLGLILHPGSYLRNPWNILDAFVVICAIVVTIISSSSTDPNADNLKATKTLRVLRVLRPLRTINRIPQLKAVFDCVVGSVMNVLNILMVYWLFQFIFAVIAVQLFSGKFFFCNDDTKMKRQECIGDFFDKDKNSTVSREWKVRCFNYDNVFYSLLTLFVVTAGDGWPDILEWSTSTTYVDQGPKPDNRNIVIIFYVVFFVIFPFFFVNVFVALTVITFQNQGEENLLSMDIDKNQKNCIDFVINAKPAFVYRPKETSGVRHRLWMFVTSELFDGFIMGMIILNTLVLMMQIYVYIPPVYEGNRFALEMSQRYISYSYSLTLLNVGFTVLFTMECVLKLVALGVINYFRDAWNVIDFVTVLGSIVDAIITFVPDVDAPTSILRLFRTVRIIKLLRKNKNIRTLLWTFVQSVKSLPYVLLLFFMLYFIYAVVAMQIFGNIEWSDDGDINQHANFRTFVAAFILLFRCSTGEAWQNIMLACTDGKFCIPGKINGKSEPNCGSQASYPFFVSFVLLCTFLMLNLFVAVIMDNFEYLTSDWSLLGSHHLDDFIQIWMKYDPDAKGKVHHIELYELLKNLDPPLGFGQKCYSDLAVRKLIRMNIPMDEEGQVHFSTTLFALVRESLLIKRDFTLQMDKKDDELRELIKTLWPSIKQKKMDLLIPPNFGREESTLTLGQLLAGKKILENWRAFKRRPIITISEAEEEGESDSNGTVTEVVSFEDEIQPEEAPSTRNRFQSPQPLSSVTDNAADENSKENPVPSTEQPRNENIGTEMLSRFWSTFNNMTVGQPNPTETSGSLSQFGEDKLPRTTLTASKKRPN